MFDIQRVCVPLGLACNLECRYCLRDMGRQRVPRLNDLMRRYVEQLNPSVIEALIVTGGEPLLYKNRMFELFELNASVHKKIMTNGILLDDALADYCNRHQIELMLSHDGEPTEFLRGVDVLKNPDLVRIIRKFDILRVNTVSTKYNTDCLKTYQYIVDHLGREDFFMTFNPCFDTGCVNELIEGYDYAEFNRTFAELHQIVPCRWAYNGKSDDLDQQTLGVNILPDGSVVSMATMKHYGTVEESWETIRDRIEAFGEFDRCLRSRCPESLKRRCIKQLASNHFCKVRFAQVATSDKEWR